MVLNIWLFIFSHSGSFEIVSKQTKKKTPKAKKNFIQTDNIPIVFLSTTQTYHTTIFFKFICILRRHIFTVLWLTLTPEGLFYTGVVTFYGLCKIFCVLRVFHKLCLSFPNLEISYSVGLKESPHQCKIK